MLAELGKPKKMHGEDHLRILGISGSARRGSYNTALLRAARELVPSTATLEVVDVSGLPLYNEDLEAEIPEEVKAFKNKVRQADAILFAVPEYNYSVSAVLKNAIEWGNRPYVDNSWDGKPAAIVSASTGIRGGVRAQLHLRQILVDLNMYPLNQPQFLMGRAQERFDRELRLTDERYREALAEMLVALVDWTLRLRNNAITVRPNAT